MAQTPGFKVIYRLGENNEGTAIYGGDGLVNEALSLDEAQRLARNIRVTAIKYSQFPSCRERCK